MEKWYIEPATVKIEFIREFYLTTFDIIENVSYVCTEDPLYLKVNTHAGKEYFIKHDMIKSFKVIQRLEDLNVETTKD